MTNSASYSPAVQLLALTRFGGMTPRLFVLLFQHFGALPEILDASAESLQTIPGINARAALRLSKASDHLDKAAKIADDLEKREIHISTHFDPDYSHLLSELNDPPPLLYVRGKMPLSSQKSVTLVGTQQATAEGIALTTRLARLFAEAGVQVISSMAGGNDAAAHLGTKAAGGISFAVIDTGFDNIAQTEGIPLAIDIWQTGGILSEYPPEFKIGDDTLEASNRLLVGLGQAVVVTEIYKDSRRITDLVDFCGQIGKLSFMVIDPAHGPLADKESLEHLLRCGVIPMVGLERTQDIIKVLV